MHLQCCLAQHLRPRLGRRFAAALLHDCSGLLHWQTTRRTEREICTPSLHTSQLEYTSCQTQAEWLWGWPSHNPPVCLSRGRDRWPFRPPTVLRAFLCQFLPFYPFDQEWGDPSRSVEPWPLSTYLGCGMYDIHRRPGGTNNSNPSHNASWPRHN